MSGRSPRSQILDWQTSGSIQRPNVYGIDSHSYENYLLLLSLCLRILNSSIRLPASFVFVKLNHNNCILYHLQYCCYYYYIFVLLYLHCAVSVIGLVAVDSAHE
jgi:hypothetical protein